jgi:hypothetical protein
MKRDHLTSRKGMLKMKTNQLLILAIGLISVLLLAACGPSQTQLDATATQIAANIFATQTAQAPTAAPTFTPTPTPRPTSTPTPTLTPTPPSPQALLESSSAALREANTYHFDMDMQMKSGTQPDVSLTLTGDFQAPDRVQARMSTSAAGTPIKTEMIIISQTTYFVNPATGNWEIASAPVAPLRPDMFTTAEMKRLEDLKLVGEENLDGAPVYHVAGTFPMKAAGLVEGDLLIEYWIGSEDALPRQITAHGDLTASGAMPTSTITITMQLSDFGKQAAIAAPRLVLYRDDFSDPSSGWDKAKTAQFTAGYEDGSYRMFLNQANYDVWANPGKGFTDASIEVTADKIGGPDNNNYGVICRYKDANNFYAFLISSDGYHLIIAKVKGEWQPLGMEQMQASSKIKQGSASNAIRADCVGDRLVLYVNGSKLMETTDTRSESGDVGLIAGTFDEPGVDIRFTDFVVYQPPESD